VSENCVHQARGLARGGAPLLIGAIALGCLPSRDLGEYSRGGAGSGGIASGGGAGSSGGLAGASAGAPDTNAGAGGAGAGAGGSAGSDAAVELDDAGADAEPTADASSLLACGADAQLGPDGQTCYFLSPGVLGWGAANQSCTASGRRLVKIESAAEDAFIAGLSDVDVWIGASDVLADNSFVWSDNTPISFANWGPAQPDAFPGPDCVEKRQEAGERWYDQPCDEAQRFVCEAPLQ
jgi:hypothetical protein